MATVTPSLAEIRAAREKFKRVEPRGLFYRAATELVELALAERTKSLSVSEAIAVLLQSWNVTFYRFKKFDLQHFEMLDELIKRHTDVLKELRGRYIQTASADDERLMLCLFSDFEALLGPVGAVKCLHLMAPGFFPLWDNEIAAKQRCRLGKAGTNAHRYLRFFECCKEQVLHLAAVDPTITDPLKAIDEYNYVTYTLPMLLRKRPKRAQTNSVDRLEPL